MISFYRLIINRDIDTSKLEQNGCLSTLDIFEYSLKFDTLINISPFFPHSPINK